jgi:hypothetical protein
MHKGGRLSPRIEHQKSAPEKLNQINGLGFQQSSGESMAIAVAGCCTVGEVLLSHSG